MTVLVFADSQVFQEFAIFALKLTRSTPRCTYRNRLHPRRRWVCGHDCDEHGGGYHLIKRPFPLHSP
jgi:hypothetical protein